MAPSDDDIQTMIDRVDKGLDIWTGKQLQGDDADNWLRIQFHQHEVETELTYEELVLLESAYASLDVVNSILENKGR